MSLIPPGRCLWPGSRCFTGFAKDGLHVDEGKKAYEQRSQEKGGVPQNSGREGHLPVDPIEEEGIQDGKVKGAYKSRGRGYDDSQGGHGHDEEGGDKGKAEAQGLFDPLDLNQVREPDQNGVENNQKPLGGAFHEDQPRTEIPDYLKDPFPKILGDEEKKSFEEIEEYLRFIFEPNQKNDDTEIDEKQQKSGPM